MKDASQKTLGNTDLSKFQGEWIAYDPKSKTIYSNAASLKVLEENVHQRGLEDYAVMEVPRSGIPFAGYAISKK